MKSLVKPLPLLVGFLLGVISITAINVISAHGGNTDLIHGCIKPTGLLRIVDANDNCGPNETPIDWEKPKTAIGSFLTDQLTNTEFGTDADLNYRNFRKVNFSNTEFNQVNLQASDFSNANFTDAIILPKTANQTNFSNALFLRTHFYENFQNAIFTNATFDNATFEHATNLLNANFTGATFTNVAWVSTTCPDGTNSNDHGNTCEGYLTP